MASFEPSDIIVFNDTEHDGVFFDGYEHDEAWMEVDGELCCVWRLGEPLAIPGDYAFIVTTSTSQGTSTVLNQYHSKTNSVTSISFNNGYLIMDLSRNTLIAVNTNYPYSNLSYSKDGINFTSIKGVDSYRNAYYAYPLLCGDGLIFPKISRYGYEEDNDYLYVKWDDKYNVTSVENIFFGDIDHSCYTEIFRNKYYRDGIPYQINTDDMEDDRIYLYHYGFFSIKDKKNYVLPFDDYGALTPWSPSTGYVYDESQVCDMHYADGKYVVLLNYRKHEYISSAYTYFDAYKILSSEDGIHWSDELELHLEQDLKHGADVSVASPMGHILYDEVEKRFIFYFRVNDKTPGDWHWWGGYYYTSNNLFGSAPLQNGYGDGDTYILCDSKASSPSGYQYSWNFNPDEPLVYSTYWNNEGDFRRKPLHISLYESYSWQGYYIRRGLYADNMYLPDATEFKIFNY